MGRPAKRKAAAASKHIIQTQPLARAPGGGGPEYVQPCRWYWASSGGWSARRKDAHVFGASGDAVRQIQKLREALRGVELTLEPVEGGTARWGLGERRQT